MHTITTNKKEAMDFKENRKGYMGGSRGGKGGKKCN